MTTKTETRMQQDLRNILERIGFTPLDVIVRSNGIATVFEEEGTAARAAHMMENTRGVMAVRIFRLSEHEWLVHASLV